MKEKSLESRMVDAFVEIGKKGAEAEKNGTTRPTLFDILNICISHFGESIENVKFSGEKEIKITKGEAL